MKKIFRKLTVIGNGIIKLGNTNILRDLFIIGLVGSAISGYLIYDKETLFWMTAFKILFAIFLITLLLGNAPKYLTSVTGFLGTGFVYYLVIILAINLLIHTGSQNVNIVICYIAAALLWWLYSLIANNKVAGIANEILSAIFAILVLIKEVIITLLPTYYLEQYAENGFTYEKIFEIVSEIIFTPPLIINIIALLLCALKGYWIEKYNGNHDVGQEDVVSIKELQDAIIELQTKDDKQTEEILMLKNQLQHYTDRE